MAEFNADSQATAMRIERLQAYFEKHVLMNGQFVCSTQRPCRESHKKGAFYAGQLPHVGLHYDLTRNDSPFRLVVVGQEYGHGPQYVSLSDRYKMIVEKSGTGSRFRAARPLPPRNPHMKGCTSVLRLLFGKDLGSDYENEFIKLEGEPKPTHIFDCFALVNFLMCSAVSGDDISDSLKLRGRQGRSTSIMQRNCAQHFKAAIEILEPTIIVIQGSGVLRWMKRALDGLSDDEIQTVRINGHHCSVLAFTHPSARDAQNWGKNDRMPYLLKVVRPAVNQVVHPKGL